MDKPVKTHIIKNRKSSPNKGVKISPPQTIPHKEYILATEMAWQTINDQGHKARGSQIKI